MATRSLNKVLLIGNLTRDPELRYTPQGTAVCSFGLATNRQWTTDQGEKKEEAEFHTIVTWNKLAEICAQYLKKGRQAYVDGRLLTRKWTGQDGTERRTTEVIANEVIFLGGPGAAPGELAVPRELGEEPQVAPEEVSQEVSEEPAAAPGPAADDQKKPKKGKKTPEGGGDLGKDIPF